MPKIYWGPMVLGALFAVVSLFLLGIAIILPFLEVIVSFDPGVMDVLFIALMIGLQVLAGLMVVALVRRRHGLETRRDAIATLLVAGLVGWVVILAGLRVAYSGPGQEVPMAHVFWTLPLFVVVPLVAVRLVSPGPPTRRGNR
jgi:hypothetical protein